MGKLYRIVKARHGHRHRDVDNYYMNKQKPPSKKPDKNNNNNDDQQNVKETHDIPSDSNMDGRSRQSGGGGKS